MFLLVVEKLPVETQTLGEVSFWKGIHCFVVLYVGQAKPWKGFPFRAWFILKYLEEYHLSPITASLLFVFTTSGGPYRAHTFLCYFGRNLGWTHSNSLTSQYIIFYARRVCQAMRLLRVLTTLEEIALIFLGTGYLAHWWLVMILTHQYYVLIYFALRLPTICFYIYGKLIYKYLHFISWSEFMQWIQNWKWIHCR